MQHVVFQLLRAAGPQTPSKCTQSLIRAVLQMPSTSLTQTVVIVTFSTVVIEGARTACVAHCGLLQVWDAVQSNLLYVWELPRSEVPSPHHADFVSSLCFNLAADGSTQLCAGCSSGVIQVCI
jgi:hypothetical protein